MPDLIQKTMQDSSLLSKWFLVRFVQQGNAARLFFSVTPP
jgi:hypothetical protein